MANASQYIGLILPVGTELVSREVVNSNNIEIDYHIGKLENDGGGQNDLSLGTGVTANECKCWKYGKLGYISFRGFKTTSTGSGWTKLADIPDGYKPAFTTYALLANDSELTSSGTSVYELRIDTNGEVKIYAPQANKNMWGGITYIIA